MSVTAWLGLGFIALLAIGGLVALGTTGRDIQRSDMDEDSKRRWGFLMGISPTAGLYAYHRRNELFGHGERHPDEAHRDNPERDGGHGGDSGGER